MLNSLFDAMNRKFPKEGIKRNSHDLEVLNEGKQWLDSWESNYDDGNITADEFLTHQTAEGLRVTIQSYIDITLYLLDECNFSYVLTSKMNQDNLEKFFGVIRQIAGPNDHPSTPTFLQLYRMLNVYSLLKPPKSGNCKVDEENKSILDITDLKELMNDTSEREEKVKKLKEKIDILIEEGDGDPEDIFLEHDYTKSTVFECVVYYLGGYLAKRLSKKTKCTLCISGLKNNNSEINTNKSELVEMKTRGFLTHPNGNMYNTLQVIETSFQKHCT
uniref:Transposable element P transposase-like RNase H C-terminal domain-containing protein n=1 Tax=Schizaphis graminum TaxID=13262 RepID=A0A2S2PSU5_SCHGA